MPTRRHVRATPTGCRRQGRSFSTGSYQAVQPVVRLAAVFSKTAGLDGVVKIGDAIAHLSNEMRDVMYSNNDGFPDNRTLDDPGQGRRLRGRREPEFARPLGLVRRNDAVFPKSVLLTVAASGHTDPAKSRYISCLSLSSPADHALAALTSSDLYLRVPAIAGCLGKARVDHAAAAHRPHLVPVPNRISRRGRSMRQKEDAGGSPRSCSEVCFRRPRRYVFQLSCDRFYLGHARSSESSVRGCCAYPTALLSSYRPPRGGTTTCASAE
jgi:hypothetical protein